MKKITGHSLTKAIVADLIIYAFFCGLLFWLGAANFCYLEHLNTFYYQGHRVVTTIELPGGLSKVIADFLIQFFVSPAAGVLITAALLAIVTILMARLVRYISDTLAYTPMAFAPAISLAFLHYNINYMYSGTVAMCLMLLAVNVMFRRDYRLLFATRSYRVIYTVVVTFFLYAAAGSVAFLFGLIVIISTLFKRPKEAPYYLICPVLTFVQAWIAVRSGLVCDLEHALMPDAYFTHRLSAPTLVWLPSVMTLGVSVLACILGLMHLGLTFKRLCFVTMCALGVVFAVIGGGIYANSENEKFKELNCLLRQGDWDAVLEACPPSKTNNLLLLNCCNLAMAEKGILADSIFKQPCIDIRNIYITGDSNPYMNMLLSDIYWSMGHIALAQRHAFEANESLDNTSPRMLQRLAQTNMVLGNYKVAEKYLRVLQHTLYYKDWATKHRAMLSDAAVAADSILSAKRACIFPDNRFSAYDGLDDDLIQVMRANPKHAATGQYLGSLYLLSKDLEAFVAMVDEFYPRQSLPLAYQEGIVAAIRQESDSTYTQYHIPEATVERYRNFKASPQSDTKNFWYFLYYLR